MIIKEEGSGEMNSNAVNNEERSSGMNYTFDLRSTLRDISRRWYNILIVASFTAVCFFVYATQTYQPVYSASTTFLVQSKTNTANTYSSLGNSMSIAQTLKTVLESSQLQSTVAEKMGYKKFPGTIYCSIVDETNIMTVGVTSDSPIKAYKVLNEALDTYPIFTKSMISRVVLKTLEPARVPSYPGNASEAFRFMGFGFLGGMIVMVAFYGVRSFFKDTIKKESDIEKKLNIKKMISIPRQKKKLKFREKVKGVKKSLSLMNPVIDFAFRESFKKLRRLVVSDSRNNNRKIYSVTSSLENEGKTTIAVNLALDLGKMDCKVLLIDADLRKPAVSKFLERPVPQGESIVDFLMGKARLSDIYHYDEIMKITIMGCNKGTPRANELITSDKMKYLLDTARKEFDYIVMDTPPLGFVADAEDIMKLSDAAMIVVRRDIATAITVNDSIDLIMDTGVHIMGCVYNEAESVPLTGGAVYGKYGYGYGYGYGYKSKYGYGYGGKYGYGKYGAYGKYADDAKSVNDTK